MIGLKKAQASNNFVKKKNSKEPDLQ